MTNKNIEMTAGTNLQEEIKMTNKNIEMTRKMVKEELSRVTEASFYVRERNYERLIELKKIKEIITDGLNRAYNIRIERGVADEDLGREIDHLRTDLHRQAGNIDRKIKEIITERNEATFKEMKEEEIEEAKEMISEELDYAEEVYFYIEETAYDEAEEMKLKKELIETSTERMYNIRTERGVSEEELGKKIDRRRNWLREKEVYVNNVIKNRLENYVY